MAKVVELTNIRKENKYQEINKYARCLQEITEMAQQLKAPAALNEDRNAVSHTHEQFTTTFNSSSSGSCALFWPPWAVHAPGAHTHRQINSQTHRVKINTFLFVSGEMVWWLRVVLAEDLGSILCTHKEVHNFL